MNIFKKFIEFRKKKNLEKLKRMDSEIRCAIAYSVYKQQQKEKVTLPIFEVINQRYKDLKITTPKDLKRVYTQFFLEGAVTGVEL